MYDSLMKSGKWTAAQNKVEAGDIIDSVSQLVAICEADGFIPKYYTDGPKDKLDRVIMDLQKYTRDLITNETNLDNMLEIASKELYLENERIKAASHLAEQVEDEDDALFQYNVPQVEVEDLVEMNDFIESEVQFDNETLREGL